ncbi:MAG: undecaprenyl-diphosphate phosphatase [Acidimicrobiia bacterium]|nr:MAG: undecaprenyl-diphosphate phosphatase [Acidimicrobiia bacterium]
MLDAILWGIIQGLTEFLPISSSGHLVLIPELLGREGPDLSTAAMLHLGTLAAVIAYYRNDLQDLARFDRPARRMITLLVIGTIPAVTLGLIFESWIDQLTENPKAVAAMLIVTGVVLLSTMLIRVGDRGAEVLTPKDAALIGLAQSAALIPGISRSGMTISAGLGRGMAPVQSARFGFLLAIPVIAGAGLLEGATAVSDGTGITAAIVAGTVVAGLVGYLAIALLIRALQRVGLGPFGLYCVTVGVVALAVL